jgi:ATP adenylyltransferase
VTIWHTPWRQAYIRGDAKRDDICVFCDHEVGDLEVDRQNLIIARSTHVYALLNLFPYSTAHLLIVPYAHVPSLEDLPTEALTDLMQTVNRALATLREAYNPQAFNIGANLGAQAGAGIPAHFHFHIVPRWAGDVNFMTTIGGTRVIPDDLGAIWDTMQAAWQKLYPETSS